jgi:hypothetical protein
MQTKARKATVGWLPKFRCTPCFNSNCDLKPKSFHWQSRMHVNLTLDEFRGAAADPDHSGLWTDPSTRLFE